MSIPYELKGSKDNPLVTERTMKFYTNGIFQLLGANSSDNDFSELKNKFKYYIVKDDIGYRIVGGEDD